MTCSVADVSTSARARGRVRSCCHQPLLTGNGVGVTSTFTTGDKDDTLLARVRVVVLEEEKLVNPIVLECRDLNHGVYGTCQATLKHEIFLATDLDCANIQFHLASDGSGAAGISPSAP